MTGKIIGFLLVLMVSLGTVSPLLGDGYFPMHDDTQIGRVVSMGKALRGGQFPVRWVTDLGYGYGYPLYNFYGPLPYYVGGFLYALGTSGLSATKVMMILGMILAGGILYVALVPFIGVLGGLIAGIFYAYAPYHAVQLYVRGAVGELWTLVFFPLLLWSLVDIHKKNPHKLGFLIGGIGLAGVILSHTLLGYATSFLLAMAAVITFFVRRMSAQSLSPLKNYILILVLGLGLSAFFWLPALVEMKYTNVAGQISSSSDFHDHLVCAPQLWSSPWGFGGSTAGCVDGMSFMLGKLHIIIGLAAGALVLLKGRFFPERYLGLTGMVITGVGIFFTLPISIFLWENIPFFSYLQYPWRFLAYAELGLSVLIGTLFVHMRAKALRFILTTIVVLLAIPYYGKWFQPQYLFTKEAREFESEKALRFDVSNISYEYLPPDFVRPASPDAYARTTIVPREGMIVEHIVQSDTYERFTVTTNKDEKITLNKTVFPGWKYLVNGKPVVPTVAQSLPTILIPKGQNVVEIRFADTPVRTLGNIISVIAVLGLFFLLGRKYEKTNT